MCQLGCVIVLFFQCLGGALATSTSQNLFTDALLKRLNDIKEIDGAAVVRAGARDFWHVVEPEVLDNVIDAFNEALKSVFIFACVSASAALFVSLGMEWRTVPREKKSNPQKSGTVQQRDHSLPELRRPLYFRLIRKVYSVIVWKPRRPQTMGEQSRCTRRYPSSTGQYFGYQADPHVYTL